jgi:hypothetical protein
MTDLSDAMRHFDNELDAAVVRARRAAAAARETSAKFRRETRELAAGVQARTGQVRPDELTDPGLRRTADGFRTDHGLPVHDLPDAHELLAAPTTPGPLRTTGSGRRTPRPSDDDEDFSQEQIMW